MKKTLFLLAFMALSGCTSYQSARNTDLAREYLTEDIEDQVIFNLIRAVNGLPFAHYDVSTVQSIVTSKVTPQIGGSRTSVSSGFQPGAIVTSAIHTVTRALNAGVGAERDDAVTVNVAPVFDEPKIYESYVKFLNLRTKSVAEYGRIAETPVKNQPAESVPKAVTTTVLTDKDGKLLGQTVETDAEMEKPTPEPPPLRIDFGKVGSEARVTSLMSDTVRPPGTSYVPHTLRKWGDLWYYVPIQFKPEFSDLCLSLVARGSRTASATGNGGPPKKKDAATKALEQLKSEFMQQNSLSLPK